MTDADLDTIRAALAAFDNRMSIKGYLQRVEPQLWIEENAPTWLAALCDEIERLRATTTDLPTMADARPAMLSSIDSLVAERDAALADLNLREEARQQAVIGWNAALAEVERVTVLCETVIDDSDSRIIKLRAERNVALAECERLRAQLTNEHNVGQPD